jgi:uncharacterized membrane protein
MGEKQGKSWLGTFFKRGLRALLPTVLTIGVLVIVFNFFFHNIVDPVNGGIRTFLVETKPGHAVMDSVFSVDVEAATYRIDDTLGPTKRNIDWKKVREDLDKVYFPFIGFIVALLLVFLAGFMLATFVGKRVLRRFESGMEKFPVVKVIYPYARQIVEFFMKDKPVTFNSVVAIEYPRRGAWSIGFVTGNGMKQISEATKQEMINVFIPSSPTPVTGYVIFFPVDEVIPLPISVDEAIRFAITGGVVIPEHQQNPENVLERHAELDAPTITQPVTLTAEELNKALGRGHEEEGD